MLSTVVAQAAAGYEIKPAQEQLVQPGMTQAEVSQALGRAERVAHYRSEPGASWTYEVARGPGADVTVFDVDFNADGTVAKTGERLVERD
jgi:outer membrane protein assembly factor BamE (lipoprotein component of BamABCDE complex)